MTQIRQINADFFFPSDTTEKSSICENPVKSASSAC